jgi:hypothetical protein
MDSEDSETLLYNGPTNVIIVPSNGCETAGKQHRCRGASWQLETNLSPSAVLLETVIDKYLCKPEYMLASHLGSAYCCH